MPVIVDREANYEPGSSPSPPWWLNPNQEMVYWNLPLPDDAIGVWVNGIYYRKPEAKSRYRGFFEKVG